MSDIKELLSEYVHEALLPFAIIEGATSVVATVLFMSQHGLMSANGMSNSTNIAMDYFKSMAMFNIFFGIASVLALIIMYIVKKVQRIIYRKGMSHHAQ